MKKFLAISGLAVAISAPAYATGLYVGVDALSSASQFQVKNIYQNQGPQNSDGQRASKNNFGVNAGFRFDLLNLYASGELFFDNLQTSANNFRQNSGAVGSADNIKLENRYGAKANIGMAILPRITPFLTYGLTNLRYFSDQSNARTELTPLYGVGILVDLPFDISVKASYDYQQFNMRYANNSAKIKTNLGVAKIGVSYNF